MEPAKGDGVKDLHRYLYAQASEAHHTISNNSSFSLLLFYVWDLSGIYSKKG